MNRNTMGKNIRATLLTLTFADLPNNKTEEEMKKIKEV